MGQTQTLPLPPKTSPLLSLPQCDFPGSPFLVQLLSTVTSHHSLPAVAATHYKLTPSLLSQGTQGQRDGERGERVEEKWRVAETVALQEK